jgi:predicted alpha/beta-hydrolase family hydrolase
MTERIRIELSPSEEVTAIVYPAASRNHAKLRLILAHGSGSNQMSSSMTRTATALAARGIETVTFNFLYSEKRKRVPDRNDKLEACWRAVIDALGKSNGKSLVIGGKSMGGRIASHVLADPAQPLPGIRGLVLLGYPLHPPGQPDRPRIAHLPHLATPTLVVQGSHDSFGTEDEVRRAFDAVPAPVEWLVVPGGDHSFKVPRRAGPTMDEVLQRVYDTVAAFVRRAA